MGIRGEGGEKLVELQRILKEREWTPMSSQMPLGCLDLRLGTMVDLMCSTKDGKLVIVEIKSGFDDYYDIQNQGNMMYPFEDVPQSCRNKHLLQLLFTTWLFFHGSHVLNNIQVEKSVIIHLFTNYNEEIQSEVIDLPFWLYGATDKYLKHGLRVMKNVKSMNKRQRTNVMVNGARKVRRRFKNK